MNQTVYLNAKPNFMNQTVGNINCYTSIQALLRSSIILNLASSCFILFQSLVYLVQKQNHEGLLIYYESCSIACARTCSCGICKAKQSFLLLGIQMVTSFTLFSFFLEDIFTFSSISAVYSSFFPNDSQI